MSYSSSLTDAEWEILEPLLPQILPSEEADTTLQLDKARAPQWHPLSTQKWL
jgi:transposase